MAKDKNSRQQAQMRERIAQAAARLIAEDGIRDYAQAKRKAARLIGAPDTHSLPSNAEIEQALRVHHQLYQREEHPARLRWLREQAVAMMRTLERFDPHLAGSVLSGTAARHSDINLQLFTDSVKDVELFLLNRQIPYKTGERRLRMGESLRVVPVFTLAGEDAAIDIAVFSTGDLRVALKGPVDGKSLERARLKQVEALLENEVGLRQVG